jgi:AAA domain
VTDGPRFESLWDDSLIAQETSPVEWIWDGLLARRNITLLTSMWKAGKTTLLSMLLRHRVSGGAMGGAAVLPGKTAVVTEEGRSLWATRARALDFGGRVCLYSRPFLTVPTPVEWQQLVEIELFKMVIHHGCDLVVIDPLAPFCHQENHSRGALNFLMPFSRLLGAGAAVLLMHHPGRKSGHRLGDAARGSGAFLGHVDISIGGWHL